MIAIFGMLSDLSFLDLIDETKIKILSIIWDFYIIKVWKLYLKFFKEI